MSRTPSRAELNPCPGSHHFSAGSMRSHTPQGDPPGSARRPTAASGIPLFRRSSGGSGIARPSTSLREPRITNFRASHQSSYNFLTGETEPSGSRSMALPTSRPSSRQGQGQASGPSPSRGRAATLATNLSRDSSKENQAPPDAEHYEIQRRRIEELKAEVGTLQYQINNDKQEKELFNLQMENELRDTKRRAEDDFKAKQAAEAENAKWQRQVEALQAELEAVREEKETQKRDLESKAREAQEESRLLQEQLEDLAAEKDEAARRAEREVNDLVARLTASQKAAQELEEEYKAQESALSVARTKLAENVDTMGSLEADVLRLKAQTGDADTIAIIRRELTDQVNHIRTLEAKNREYLTELKHLRQVHKAVEVVEEEKRSLQRRLERTAALEAELQEETRQRRRLEDERLAWTAYLQSESSAGEPVEFDSPEALARALIAERLSSASLVEKLGALEPEITDRENIIKTLETEKAQILDELEKLKSVGVSPGTNKPLARVERQRALAVKEVEYLRAQLKTFEMEDETMQPDSIDQARASRIQELEELVNNYKKEVETLHAELTSLESITTSPAQPVTGSKRPRDTNGEAESEQLGQLSRKNRKLQSEFAELQVTYHMLQKEHTVVSEQLIAAKEQLKTRVLSLRSNPTSEFQAVKAAAIQALKQENADLLAVIQRQPKRPAMVPASQLAAAQREVDDARAKVASVEKTSRRLKEVWAAKSAEFKEAVFSTLGWTVSFIPGGKMRVESVYYPSQTDEHENSIVFDGEKGTMKVGGGPRSAFAERIGDNIKFWVREKGCVPCFLAALTLEFYEEHTRAVTSA